MATLNVRDMRRLMVLRDSLAKRKSEDGEFVDFLLEELRLKDDTNQENLKRELEGLERLIKFRSLRTEWQTTSEESRELIFKCKRREEMSLKWHSLFVAEKEISEKELSKLSVEQLELLKEIDEDTRQCKWQEIFEKKNRQLEHYSSVETIVGDVAIEDWLSEVDIWSSSIWSPNAWKRTLTRFITSRPVITVSEQPVEDCPICCGPFPRDAIVLPADECISLSCMHNASHYFHRSCLQLWFDSGHTTCPVCRTSHSNSI